MRDLEDLITLMDAISRIRDSGVPEDIAEAAVRATFEAYAARSHDARLLALAERLALFPPTEKPAHDPQPRPGPSVPTKPAKSKA